MTNAAHQALPPRDVYTVEEVASYLMVEPDRVLDAIRSGQLKATHLGDAYRVLRVHLCLFLGIEQLSNPPTDSERPVSKAGYEFRMGKPFKYTWPNEMVEEYDEAWESAIEYENGKIPAVIGFGNRESAGKQRRRAVVFMNGYPTVEFIGANDFNRTGMMVSVIKDRNGKQVKSKEALPAEYKTFVVGTFNKTVVGPYASGSLAVTAYRKDFTTMIRHALVRMKFKHE